MSDGGNNLAAQAQVAIERRGKLFVRGTAAGFQDDDDGIDFDTEAVESARAAEESAQAHQQAPVGLLEQITMGLLKKVIIYGPLVVIVALMLIHYDVVEVYHTNLLPKGEGKQTAHDYSNSTFKFDEDDAIDCNWVDQRTDIRCKGEWKGESIANFWCPKSCKVTYLTTSSSTNPTKTIIYLSDPEIMHKKAPKKAGLQGTCDCDIQGVFPKDFANLEWGTISTVIVFVNTAERNQDLLHHIPPGVVKVLFWREASWETIKPEVQAKFDIIMGTHFTDAVLNPCHYPARFDKQILPITKNPFSKRTHLIGHISSHCGVPFRDKFIMELQKHIDVEVYGECATKEYNITIPPKHGHKNEKEELREFYSNFKFFLAVENTGDNGYVSEKIFNSLGSRAIPVYLGASRINEFPTLDGNSKWFINARDFPTVEALTKYLLDLASDEKKFQEYLEWYEYAQSGGTWMPNAPSKMKECFETKNMYPDYNLIQHRHEFICKLCQSDYLETIKQRGRETVEKIGYPSTWEISHDYEYEA